MSLPSSSIHPVPMKPFPKSSSYLSKQFALRIVQPSNWGQPPIHCSAVRSYILPLSVRTSHRHLGLHVEVAVHDMTVPKPLFVVVQAHSVVVSFPVGYHNLIRSPDIPTEPKPPGLDKRGQLSESLVISAGTWMPYLGQPLHVQSLPISKDDQLACCVFNLYVACALSLQAVGREGSRICTPPLVKNLEQYLVSRPLLGGILSNRRFCRPLLTLRLILQHDIKAHHDFAAVSFCFCDPS